jgi:hypothetical protein
MPSLHQRFMATLPGFSGEKTYAAWPVWSGSTTTEVKFQAMPKGSPVGSFKIAR